MSVNNFDKELALKLRQASGSTAEALYIGQL